MFVPGPVRACVTIALASLLLCAPPASAQDAPYTAGQDVQVYHLGDWAPGRVIKQDQWGILVMLPLADGTYDPKKSASSCFQPSDVRLPPPPKETPPPPPGTQYAEGQEVETYHLGDWAPGRVVKQDRYGILVMFPLADGTYDPKKSASSYFQPDDVRTPQPAKEPPPGQNPAGGAEKFKPGQEVFVDRFGDIVPGQVVKQDKDGVLVRLPLEDGTYDPHKSFQSYYPPADVFEKGPDGKPVMPAAAPPAGGPPAAEPPADGAPATGGADPAKTGLVPDGPTDTAGAENFIGTWETQGQVVYNVVEEKEVSNGYVRQLVERGGGAVGGYVDIKVDGTFVRSSPAGVKSRGKWTKNTKDNTGGIVLWGGDVATGFGDLVVRERPGGEILLQSLNGGGAGFRGWKAKDPSQLDLEPWTDPKFFQTTWSIYRKRKVPLKTDYGTLTVNADGTFSHSDGGKTTKGTWEAIKENDWIVLHGLPTDDGGDFTMNRLGADKRLGWIHGKQPANAHLAYYATPKE